MNGIEKIFCEIYQKNQVIDYFVSFFYVLIHTVQEFIENGRI